MGEGNNAFPLKGLIRKMAKNLFKIGTKCKNDVGWFTVVSEPVQGKMTVVYDSGKVAMLLSALELGNLRASKTELAEMMHENIANQPASEEDYYIALGWFAKNSYLQVEMNNQYFPTYQMQHFEMTGNVIEDDKENGVWADGIESKWIGGVQMRLTFHDPLFKHIKGLPFEVLQCKGGKDDSVCQVNSNGLVKGLLKKGFTFGNSQDIEKIKDFVPLEYRDAFEIGYEVATEANLPKIDKLLVGTHRVYPKVKVQEVAKITVDSVCDFAK